MDSLFKELSYCVKNIGARMQCYLCRQRAGVIFIFIVGRGSMCVGEDNDCLMINCSFREVAITSG